ncbi:hypothetical protein Bpfe_011580, partial [Biomphalaria pfeifferi]
MSRRFARFSCSFCIIFQMHTNCDCRELLFPVKRPPGRVESKANCSVCFGSRRLELTPSLQTYTHI